MLIICAGLSETAFQKVLDFRQLERIPLSAIAESVGGETQLHGLAEPLTTLLSAPQTGAQCIYYRYLLEREETDSDGDTHWRTVTDSRQATDFYLRDKTGTARINALASETSIRWSVKQKYVSEAGGYRHTEWRIDPQDPLTIFGWLAYAPEPAMDFSTPGQYQPIISSFLATTERADLAFTAILLLWGGLSVLIAACLALIFTLQIHRTLVFLMLISSSGSLLLVHYGVRSVEQDVSAGYQRVTNHSRRADQLIARAMQNHKIDYAGLSVPFDLADIPANRLSPVDRHQINAWRRGAYEVYARYMLQIQRFPESYVAKASGAAQPSAIKLPKTEQAVADAQLLAFQSTRTTASPWWVLLLTAATGIAAWLAFMAIRTKRMQENIPCSKTAGVVFGLAEVKGSLVPEDNTTLLTGPLSQQSCTWYHYVIQEQRGSGKKKSWHTVHDEIKKQPFYCADDEGRIRIFPGQAECITEHIATEHRGNRRYTERWFAPDDNLYILGKARLDKTRGDTLVFGHEQGSPYIIANITEEAVMLRKALKGMSLMAGALSLLFLGALLTIGNSGQMSSVDFLLASLVAPAFMLLVVFILMFNDLVFLRQRCARNWANIQVSLKKRATLLPQLEAVVKRYLTHEQDLQTELVTLRELRTNTLTAADLDHYSALEYTAITQLRAQLEAYPQLEGMDLVADFNGRLITLENEVALIRAGYNDAVTNFATRLQTFPDNLLARLFGFKAPLLLQFRAAAHAMPSVAFTKKP